MKTTHKLAVTLAAFGIAAASYALAQEATKPDQQGTDHSTMGHGTMAMGMPKGDTGPSSTAFAEANARMHAEMDIEFSGNADIDFAKGMIAHHKGAVDMAKVELEFGKDEEMRKLAEAIIAAQGPEIEQMEAWLAKQTN